MVDALADLRLCRINQTENATRLPRNTSMQMPAKDSHDFRWQGKMWICSQCLYRTTNPFSLCRSCRFCLKGNPLAPVLRNENGHKLWAAKVAGGGNVVFCSRCWHYASAYPRKLLKPCSPPLRVRPCAKFHIINRRHPVNHSRLLLASRVRVS